MAKARWVEFDSVVGMSPEDWLKLAKQIEQTPEIIEPDWAREVLDTKNMYNRNMRATHVASLAKMFGAKRGVLTFDPICFDENGYLINGQNRLKAIVESGVALPAYVFRNVPIKFMLGMDQGSKRQPHDILKIEPLESQICKVIAMYVLETNIAIVETPIVQLLATEFEDELVQAGKLRKYASRELKTGRVSNFAAAMLCFANPQYDQKVTFERLKSYVSGKKDMPDLAYELQKLVRTGRAPFKNVATYFEYCYMIPRLWLCVSDKWGTRMDFRPLGPQLDLAKREILELVLKRAPGLKEYKSTKTYSAIVKEENRNKKEQRARLAPKLTRVA